MGNSPTTVLQIAPRYCAQPTAGAEFRNYYLGKYLADWMRVTHAGFLQVTEARGEQPKDASPEHRFIAVPREGSYRIPDLVRGAVGRVPFSVLNYKRAGMRATIAKLLSATRFDIVLLEGVHLGEYLPMLRAGAPQAAVVCDWHNIESEILQRYSETAPGWARQQYARRTAEKLAAYEQWFVNQCDMHVVVSERDREKLLDYGARVPVIVIENGVPLSRFCRSTAGEISRKGRFRIVFTGAMDYHANIEAVTEFAQEVWPRLRAGAPSLVFTIVGRNPAPEVRKLAQQEGIEVTGMVPDVWPYYVEAAAAVMPLRVGGGTRIKILEAMAAGVPVVSTGIGAEGLAATPGIHYLLANSRGEMLAALQDLLRDPARKTQMTEAARDFVRRHDWALLGERLAQELLGLRGRRARAAGSGG
jgi:polysaccharide biosynthesis protein PslH